jgi:hypothetical protein
MYLRISAKQAGKHGLEVPGDCLMNNHVHLAAVPPTEDCLVKGIGRIHTGWALGRDAFLSTPETLLGNSTAAVRSQ